jgi:acetyl esterase/lipase
MSRICLLMVIVFLLANRLSAQLFMPLYADSIPNSVDVSAKRPAPGITVYLPPKERATGTAIIIFPGGGYTFLATAVEGTPIAEAFVQRDIAAFVVNYRLPVNTAMQDKSMIPLMDAQQAIKLVKLRCKEWNVDSNRVGIIGYSAGGHLASTLGTHYETSYIPNKESISLRPAFMILVYPVISMTNALTHLGSRRQLLGPDPSQEQVLFFSGEANVTEQSPPTYITHAGDDRIVDVQNSIMFYQTLQQKGVAAELHIYPQGDHGFIIRQPVEEWLEPMLRFLKRGGWYYVD